MSEKELHGSKSFAFVFQWPSNLTDPHQSLGIKANGITRFSHTSHSISYLLGCGTKVIQRWMKCKDFPAGLNVRIYRGFLTFRVFISLCLINCFLQSNRAILKALWNSWMKTVKAMENISIIISVNRQLKLWKEYPERQMNGQEVKQLFKGENMGNSNQGF